MFIAPEAPLNCSLRQERHGSDFTIIALLWSAKHLNQNAINIVLLRST